MDKHIRTLTRIRTSHRTSYNIQQERPQTGPSSLHVVVEPIEPQDFSERLSWYAHRFLQASAPGITRNQLFTGGLTNEPVNILRSNSTPSPFCRLHAGGFALPDYALLRIRRHHNSTQAAQQGMPPAVATSCTQATA